MNKKLKEKSKGATFTFMIMAKMNAQYKMDTDLL